MTETSIVDWGDWAGAIATVVGLVFIWLQVRDARKTARNQFLLNLDERLNSHREIYLKILKSEIDAASLNNKEIEADLWSYIGFFERINLLLRDGILNISEVDDLYAYRVEKIVENDPIYCQYLIDQSHSWHNFTRLAKKLVLYQKSIGYENPCFHHRVQSLNIHPRKSEINWRYGGRNVLYYEQPEFTFVVKQNDAHGAEQELNALLEYIRCIEDPNLRFLFMKKIFLTVDNNGE